MPDGAPVTLDKCASRRPPRWGMSIALWCVTMMIGRCAWHVLYFGRPRWAGVTSWRGLSIQFTDGICARCLERFREEHRATLTRRDAPVAEEASKGAA